MIDDVWVQRTMTPEQIRAYRIADNQTATIAEWNMDLLPLELLALQEVNYDLGLLGFDAEELARILGQEVNDGLCDPDDVPEPPDEAVTQPGDLWLLGDHRLLCGDSSSPADLDRLLNGAAIHLINSDPPYNVKVEPRSNNAIAAGLTAVDVSMVERAEIPKPERGDRFLDVRLKGSVQKRQRIGLTDLEFWRVDYAMSADLPAVLE